MMTTMNISLSDALKAFVDEQATVMGTAAAANTHAS
jgi:hypothetical protein